MDIVKSIGKLFTSRDASPRFDSSFKKVKEADLITESINQRLKELKNNIDQKPVKL